MLDHLGLGIVLTMQDDFTPQANKAVQAMDRLSNRAEQLEREMQKSMSNLQNIMLAGFSLNQVGGEFERTGKKILGAIQNTFTGLGRVGKEFETLKHTMEVFFRESTDEAMKWGVELASKTPFEIEPVIRAMSSFKAIQIDVRKQFEYINAEGKKAQKSFMEFIGDLGAFRPDKGVEGAMMAIRNYIGGNKRSLRQLFDVDERLIIGREFDTSNMDNFQKDFVEFVNKLAPDMMKNLEGTVDQVLSNLRDKWTWFVYQIGQSGAFDAMKKTLRDITGIIDEIDLDKTAKVIGEIFTSLWKPIDKVTQGIARLVKGIAEFTEQHPMIAKIVIGFTAIFGTLSVLSGTIMKLTGNFLILTTSIVSAYANLQVLSTLNKVSIFSGLNLQIGAVIRNLGLLGIIVGIVAIGFKRNVDGIRDRWEMLTKAWKQSGEILEMGASRGIRNFEMVFDRAIDNITTKLMRFRLIGTVIFTTLFGKTVNGVLQYSQKDIENLRVMGLLPFAQTMAMIRGRVKSFFEGFESGITKAYEVAKNFLDFVLIPIKAVFESLSKLAPIKAISNLFGVKSEAGIDMEVAKGSMAQFEKLGEIAGGLIGTLIGFKVVGSLTSIITKPFKGLFDILGKTKGATDELKDSMSFFLNPLKKGRKGGLQLTQLDENFNPVGDYDSLAGRWTRAKLRFKSFLGERSELPKASASSYEGYDRVLYSNVPKNFRDYNLKEGTNPYDLYIKQPKGLIGRLSQALFGAKYYTPSKDGSGMEYVGRYGGRLTQFRDDTQTRLSSQSLGITPPTVADIKRLYGGDIASWKRDRAIFINQDIKVGSMMDIKGSDYSQIEENLRRSRDARIQELISNPQFRRKAYRDAGISGRSFNMREADRISFLTRYAYDDPLVQQRSKELQDIRDYANTYAPIFQAKQSKLSQFLFGQRIYTPEQDEQGRWYERTVARRGGIFRDPANDMVFNDEGDVSLGARARRMWGAIADSRLGRAVGGATSGIRGGLGSLLGGVRRGAGAVGGFFGRIANAPLNALNKQRARLGWDELSYGGIGRWIFGRAQYDEEGNMIDRGGLLSRAGRGIRAVGRGIGRGIGAVGRGVMRALPFVSGALSVGRMGYQVISQLGGEEGFEGGVQKLRDIISNMDFKEVFDKFTEDFKKNIGVLLPLVKDIFGKIAEALPSILAKAWEGIKAGASLAWQFINEHGLDILKGMVDLILPLFGKAWEWITTDGLDMLGKFVGSAVEWLISDGIPMFIKALLGIGKWLITDGIPGLLKIVSSLALDIGKGLFDGVLSVLGGIGTALGEIMMGGLKGALKLLLPKPLEKPVFEALGLEYHHRGLWMSEDEHPAIIKKDETVLPPDKSRKLDYFLEYTLVPSRVGQNQPQQVDNSINIDKVEIIVQADKLSRADARNQAKMILEEFKKLQKEKNIRQYV